MTATSAPPGSPAWPSPWLGLGVRRRPARADDAPADGRGEARIAQVRRLQGPARRGQGAELQVHPRRRLGDLVRPLQGELPAPRRDAQEVRRQGAGRRLALARRPDRAQEGRRGRRRSSRRRRPPSPTTCSTRSTASASRSSNINAIPAVFLYGPDGKEVKRFTLDDPNNQFTYERSRRPSQALLDGKPLDRRPTPPVDEVSRAEGGLSDPRGRSSIVRSDRAAASRPDIRTSAGRRRASSDEGEATHERRHPPQVSGRRRDLRLRQHVQDPQHQAEDRGRGLLEVPPVLHRAR